MTYNSVTTPLQHVTPGHEQKGVDGVPLLHVHSGISRKEESPHIATFIKAEKNQPVDERARAGVRAITVSVGSIYANKIRGTSTRGAIRTKKSGALVTIGKFDILTISEVGLIASRPYSYSSGITNFCQEACNGMVFFRKNKHTNHGVSAELGNIRE